MYVDMTGQTVWEHLKLLFVVGHSVAISAVRNFAMLLVAPDTDNLTMLARRPLPLAINIIMTAAAGLNVCIPWETDSQWRMNSFMTGHTSLYRLFRKVTIMTFKTVRYITVLFVMAALAALFSVRTRKFFQFICRAGMTVSTSFTKPVHRRNV